MPAAALAAAALVVVAGAACGTTASTSTSEGSSASERVAVDRLDDVRQRHSRAVDGLEADLAAAKGRGDLAAARTAADRRRQEDVDTDSELRAIAWPLSLAAGRDGLLRVTADEIALLDRQRGASTMAELQSLDRRVQHLALPLLEAESALRVRAGRPALLEGAAGTASPPGRRLFVDDFSDSSSGWVPERSDDHASLGYADGAYRMAVTLPGEASADTTAFGPRFRPDLSQLSDVSVEADATKTNDDADGSFGLLCRVDTRARQAYAATIDTTGFRMIARVEGGRRVPLSDPSPVALTAAVRPPGQADHLRFDCRGGMGSAATLTLYVNDQKVLEVTDAHGLGTGAVGMTAERGPGPFDDDVAFDNLSVAECPVGRTA